MRRPGLLNRLRGEVKIKVKFHPRTGNEGPQGDQRYSSTLSLTSTIHMVSGQRDAPTAVLTYLLSSRSTVLLEKLTGSQLIKKFPAFYGKWKFINAFTRTRHQSLF